MGNKEFDLYKDIKGRTKGEIYIGVVGPVRTGKSTFIKRFMEVCVLPHMSDENEKKRALDELPQSASGSTIMTTEPKFIPQEAASIKLDEDTTVRVRLVDCVGYAVEGASGYMDGDKERMVHTPWQEEDISMENAAYIGTSKVIYDHSTIAIMVTTDGSIGSISRSSYIEAEEKTISQLKASNKPYIVILNTANPYSQSTQELCDSLAKNYSTTVIPLNCSLMGIAEALGVLERILYEFAITRVNFFIPKWVVMLPSSSDIKRSFIDFAREFMCSIDRVKDVLKEAYVDAVAEVNKDGIIKDYAVSNVDLSTGEVDVKLEVEERYYYENISQLTGVEITNEEQLISLIIELIAAREEYRKYEDAILSVTQKGYGVVMPELSDITMEEPMLITHGNKYGVKMNAISPSIHMIRANIETEIAPIVGNREQAEDLIDYIATEKSEGDGIWSTNIFGKSIGELMEDGIRNKILLMDDECQLKLQDTMQKIVNDSNGGMICIII